MMGTTSPEDGHFMEVALRHAEIAISRGQSPCGAVVLDRDGRSTVASVLDAVVGAGFSAERVHGQGL